LKDLYLIVRGEHETNGKDHLTCEGERSLSGLGKIVRGHYQIDSKDLKDLKFKIIVPTYDDISMQSGGIIEMELKLERSIDDRVIDLYANEALSVGPESIQELVDKSAKDVDALILVTNQELVNEYANYFWDHRLDKPWAFHEYLQEDQGVRFNFHEGSWESPE